MIENFARNVSAGLLDQSGSVFFSGREAFSNKGKPLYILGANPGGDPDKQAGETVRLHIEKVLRKPANWSEYRDESWAGSPPGTWRMQPRILHLLGRLGLDPGTVPASNVVFVRSRRLDKLKRADFKRFAEVCWPFHRAVIDTIEPRVVLCLGGDAAKFVRKKVGANERIGGFIEANNRRWPSEVFRNGDGLVVVRAAHPSRSDWTNPATDPSGLVKDALDGILKP